MSPCHLQSLTSSPPLLSPPPPLILAPPPRPNIVLPMVFLLFLALAIIIVFLFFFLLALHRHRPTLMLALLGAPSLHTTFPPVLSSCSPRCLLPLLPLCATSTSSNQGSYYFLKDFSRTLFQFFKDFIQCEQEPRVYVFLVVRQHEKFYPEGLSVFAPLGTWESGLDKVSTEIRGLSSTGACKAEPCPTPGAHQLLPTLMFVLFTISLPPPSPTTLPCSATLYKYKEPTRAWEHGS